MRRGKFEGSKSYYSHDTPHCLHSHKGVMVEEAHIIQNSEGKLLFDGPVRKLVTKRLFETTYKSFVFFWNISR